MHSHSTDSGAQTAYFCPLSSGDGKNRQSTQKGVLCSHRRLRAHSFGLSSRSSESLREGITFKSRVQLLHARAIVKKKYERNL